MSHLLGFGVALRPRIPVLRGTWIRTAVGPCSTSGLTRPFLTGSALVMKTMGIVLVSACAADDQRGSATTAALDQIGAEYRQSFVVTGTPRYRPNGGVLCVTGKTAAVVRSGSSASLQAKPSMIAIAFESGHRSSQKLLSRSGDSSLYRTRGLDVSARGSYVILSSQFDCHSY
jgi:hypothetical protein